MRIVAADSGAAVLNQEFEPLLVVAAAAVLVEPPYQRANLCLAQPIFAKVEQGYLLVVNELELCKKLLKETNADVIHLDMTLGGISVEELSVSTLSRIRVSSRARKHILKIIPKIRKLGADIKRLHNIDVKAIGKDSIPVRIAELTSGACAVLYSAQKALEEDHKIVIGLPAQCRVRFLKEEGVVLESLAPAERDIAGYAKDDKNILERVQVLEMPNPCARGFRALEVAPEP